MTYVTTGAVGGQARQAVCRGKVGSLDVQAQMPRPGPALSARGQRDAAASFVLVRSPKAGVTPPGIDRQGSS